MPTERKINTWTFAQLENGDFKEGRVGCLHPLFMAQYSWLGRLPDKHQNAPVWGVGFILTIFLIGPADGNGDVIIYLQNCPSNLQC